MKVTPSINIAAAAVAAGESMALVVPGRGVPVLGPLFRGVLPGGSWAEGLRWWRGRAIVLGVFKAVE